MRARHTALARVCAVVEACGEAGAALALWPPAPRAPPTPTNAPLSCAGAPALLLRSSVPVPTQQLSIGALGYALAARRQGLRRGPRGLLACSHTRLRCMPVHVGPSGCPRTLAPGVLGGCVHLCVWALEAAAAATTAGLLVAPRPSRPPNAFVGPNAFVVCSSLGVRRAAPQRLPAAGAVRAGLRGCSVRCRPGQCRCTQCWVQQQSINQVFVGSRQDCRPNLRWATAGRFFPLVSND